MRRRVLILVLALGVFAALPAPALAAKQLESTFQDDNHLVLSLIHI